MVLLYDCAIMLGTGSGSLCLGLLEEEWRNQGYSG